MFILGRQIKPDEKPMKVDGETLIWDLDQVSSQNKKTNALRKIKTPPKPPARNAWRSRGQMKDLSVATLFLFAVF